MVVFLSKVKRKDEYPFSLIRRDLILYFNHDTRMVFAKCVVEKVYVAQEYYTYQRKQIHVSSPSCRRGSSELPSYLHHLQPFASWP